MSQTSTEGIWEHLPEVELMGQSYRDLIAWRKAMDFVVEIYRATRSLPHDERFGLTIQMRRAAVAVPCKIAEGQAHYSPREFHHFLSQARGSLVEIETQVLIAEHLAYLPSEEVSALLSSAAELGKILNGLIASTKSAA